MSETRDTARGTGRPSIARQVDQVPDAPGVYLWKDAADEVLYVGKAKSLRKRMKQYTGGHDDRAQIPLMMEQVDSFDYVVTDTEVESLILEKNLIGQYKPPFNVDYRDDKSYPYIALTTGDPFPAIKYTREQHRKGTTYFGPYTDAKAARETIEAVRRIYPICSAQCAEWKRLTRAGGEPQGKACFDFHVGKGPGPCAGAVTLDEYATTVSKVARFLQGKHEGVAEELDERMQEAAADLDYELAARYRNRLAAVRLVEERQKIVTETRADMDIVGITREETIAGVHVFIIREGRIINNNEFVLDKGLDVPHAELIEGFLLRYYDEASHVPKEIHLPGMPCDPDAVEAWLAERRGTKVKLRVPRKGDKRRLMELAETNARHVLQRFKVRTRYDEERLNLAMLQLESALALPAPPMRIESFDISTLHGRHSVGSMVVFSAGRPAPTSYRRFRVRMDTGQSNDVAMMSEVLSRRFAAPRTSDERFAERPDLVIIDGGKPQLGVAVEAMSAAGYADVPVVGLAKREEELWVPGWDDPVILPAGSASLYLIKRVRDEAHRFAITYHRELRSKAMKASALDDIPGVGPTRKKVLLKAFGSVRDLRAASADEIAAVPGIPREVAEDVHAVLGGAGETPEDT